MGIKENYAILVTLNMEKLAKIFVGNVPQNTIYEQILQKVS